MRDKVASIRRMFAPYTVILVVISLLSLSLLLCVTYYRTQEDPKYLTMTLDDELGPTARIERSRLEIHLLLTRSRLEHELELIKSSNHNDETAAPIDKSKWTTMKDNLKRILENVNLKSSDQLYVGIKSAITDIDELLLL